MEGDGPGMNFPTSDIQFLAQIVKRIAPIVGTLSVGEVHRLEEIATKGFSSPADAPTTTSGG